MIEMQQKSFTYVVSNSALEAAVASMETKNAIAVDLEADSMYHFKEQVCLIQIFDGAHLYLIDPFQVDHLDSLKPIFQNPGIQKILHGSDYDIRSLFRDFGIEIENLFDTELACRFLGYRETGLESVLSANFQIHLDKKYQKKDWSLRPLPEPMLEYAALDVAYLVPLAEMLRADLMRKDRLAWVLEECDLLTQVRAAPTNGKPLFIRVGGAGRLDARGLGILEAMLEFRQAIAERKDRPVFKILSNQTLLQLAKSKPTDLEKIAALDVLSPKQMEMYGQSLLHIIFQVLKAPSGELPRYPRRPAQKLKPWVPERVRKLKTWRDAQADRLGLDPSILFNKSMLTAIAEAKPSSVEELAEIPGVRNWQKDAFGDTVVRILAEMRER